MGKTPYEKKTAKQQKKPKNKVLLKLIGFILAIALVLGALTFGLYVLTTNNTINFNNYTDYLANVLLVEEIVEDRDIKITQLNASEAARTTLTNEKTALEEAIVIKDAAILAKDAEITANNAAILALQIANTSQTAEIIALESANAILQAEKLDLEDERDDLTADLQTVNGQLVTANVSILALQNEIRALDAQNLALQAEIATLEDFLIKDFTFFGEKIDSYNLLDSLKKYEYERDEITLTLKAVKRLDDSISIDAYWLVNGIEFEQKELFVDPVYNGYFFNINLAKKLAEPITSELKATSSGSVMLQQISNFFQENVIDNFNVGAVYPTAASLICTFINGMELEWTIPTTVEIVEEVEQQSFNYNLAVNKTEQTIVYEVSNFSSEHFFNLSIATFNIVDMDEWSLNPPTEAIKLANVYVSGSKDGLNIPSEWELIINPSGSGSIVGVNYINEGSWRTSDQARFIENMIIEVNFINLEEALYLLDVNVMFNHFIEFKWAGNQGLDSTPFGVVLWPEIIESFDIDIPLVNYILGSEISFPTENNFTFSLEFKVYDDAVFGNYVEAVSTLSEHNSGISYQVRNRLNTLEEFFNIQNYGVLDLIFSNPGVINNTLETIFQAFNFENYNSDWGVDTANPASIPIGSFSYLEQYADLSFSASVIDMNLYPY